MRKLEAVKIGLLIVLHKYIYKDFFFILLLDKRLTMA